MQQNTDEDLGLSSDEIINECMVVSALQSTELALESGLRPDQIIISSRSRVHGISSRSIAIWRAEQPAAAPGTDRSRHGRQRRGVVRGRLVDSSERRDRRHDSRVTHTAAGRRSAEEVYAACEILQALGLRSFSPAITACPGCGRTTSSTFQELAERVQTYVRTMMPVWKTQHPGVESMSVAVMGCVVNGPGESKAANIGISLPGTGESPNCPVFVDGQHVTTLRGTYDELAAAFQKLVDDYVERKYPASQPV